MYIINTIPHVKCFVRYLPTRCFCIRNLTRSISDTSTTRAWIPYASTFHEVFSIYWPRTGLWNQSRPHIGHPRQERIMAETQQPPTKNIFVPHNSHIGNSIIIVFMMHRGLKKWATNPWQKFWEHPFFRVASHPWKRQDWCSSHPSKRFAEV